ncbi:hypothetical protein PC128_g18438 [Phytophthora cactorum]|nr:hypothetical protein PC128_g18438 [Phytophthora cactorum]
MASTVMTTPRRLHPPGTYEERSPSSTVTLPRPSTLFSMGVPRCPPFPRRLAPQCSSLRNVVRVSSLLGCMPTGSRTPRAISRAAHHFGD